MQLLDAPTYHKVLQTFATLLVELDAINKKRAKLTELRTQVGSGPVGQETLAQSNLNASIQALDKEIEQHEMNFRQKTTLEYKSIQAFLHHALSLFSSSDATSPRTIAIAQASLHLLEPFRFALSDLGDRQTIGTFERNVAAAAAAQKISPYDQLTEELLGIQQNLQQIIKYHAEFTAFLHKIRNPVRETLTIEALNNQISELENRKVALPSTLRQFATALAPSNWTPSPTEPDLLPELLAFAQLNPKCTAILQTPQRGAWFQFINRQGAKYDEINQSIAAAEAACKEFQTAHHNEQAITHKAIQEAKAGNHLTSRETLRSAKRLFIDIPYNEAESIISKAIEPLERYKKEYRQLENELNEFRNTPTTDPRARIDKAKHLTQKVNQFIIEIANWRKELQTKPDCEIKRIELETIQSINTSLQSHQADLKVSNKKMVVMATVAVCLLLVAGVVGLVVWMYLQTSIEYKVIASSAAGKPTVTWNGEPLTSGDRVSPGAGEFKVTLDRHEPYTEYMNIQFGEKKTIPAVTLRPIGGKIRITSEPDHVDFEIVSNGAVAHKGTTPETTPLLDPGSYTIHARRGTWPLTQEITIADGDQKEINFSFKYGSIEVDTTPDGAQATLVGTGNTRETPASFLELKPGSYGIDIQYKNFSYTTNVTVPEQGSVSFTVNFAQSHLALQTTPPGATLKLDNKEIGTSPWSTTNATVGTSQVIATLDGHITRTGTVQILPNQTNGLSLELKPSPAAADSYTNSIGMKFKRLPNTPILLSIWETRVQDIKAWQKSYRSPFGNINSLPATALSYNQAVEFCNWLTQKERKDGWIEPYQAYRVMNSQEWNMALGIRDDLQPMSEAEMRSIRTEYPWGTTWPPPENIGNLAPPLKADNADSLTPVGSFPPTARGYFDLIGNVREMTSSPSLMNPDGIEVRGSSYDDEDAKMLTSVMVLTQEKNAARPTVGFRIVLTPTQ